MSFVSDYSITGADPTAGTPLNAPAPVNPYLLSPESMANTPVPGTAFSRMPAPQPPQPPQQAPDQAALPPNAQPAVGTMPPGGMSAPGPGGPGGSFPGMPPELVHAVKDSLLSAPDKPTFLQSVLGVDSNTAQRVSASLATGLTSVGQNWNKPGLAAFAGSAGAAIGGGNKEQQQQTVNRQTALKEAIAAYSANNMAAYHKSLADYHEAVANQGKYSLIPAEGGGAISYNSRTGEVIPRPDVKLGAKPDTLARVGAQDRATDVRAGIMNQGQWRDLGPTPANSPQQGSVIMNAKTGEMKVVPQEIDRTKGGNAGGVTAWKYNTWLAAHPGDHEGALQYAGGHKGMTDQDITKAALNFARGDLKDDPSTGADRDKLIRDRAEQYADLIKKGFTPPTQAGTAAVTGQAPGQPAAPAAPAQPAPAAQPAQPAPAAAGGQAAPAIQRPTNVPPGSAYSQSRRQWRTPDGQILDQNGVPAQGAQ